MTPEKLATKLRFAGKAVPSMTRRREGHDYLGRRMYLITMTVEGRRPLLGAVVGNPEAVRGAADAPRMELSPLGKAVEEHWMEISKYHPQIEVLALQLMPDHLHSIIFVKEKMPQHLGMATGVMRVLNNRHYVSDVLVGAAVGILTAELAYWATDAIFNDWKPVKPHRRMSSDYIIKNY